MSHDFYCVDDFTDDFAGTDLVGSVMQDAYHRLLIDVLPPFIEYGRDVRKLCAGTITNSSAAALGPELSAIIQRDERVAACDCICSATPLASSVYKLTIDIGITTETGESFRFVVGANETIAEIVRRTRGS